jgi:lipopolysaccharide export system protein LptA
VKRRTATSGRDFFAVAAVTAVLALGGANAFAQQNQGPANALQGFSKNRGQPVKIQAAALEVRDKDKLATFTGDVHVVQGDTQLRSKVLVVFYEEEPGKPAMPAAQPGPGGQQQIKRMEAKGGVVVTQKDQTAVGDTAEFEMQSNTVTLTGNVVVTQGQDVVKGHKLVVDLTTGVSKFDGGRVDALFNTGRNNQGQTQGQAQPQGQPPQPARPAQPLRKN